LKGFLTFKGHPLQKTHNLSILVQLCLDHDATFSEILVETIELNGLDVAFRYPGESTEILELDYAQQVVESASRIWQFVKEKCE
jgi:HEPN domain-containing protein